MNVLDRAKSCMYILNLTSFFAGKRVKEAKERLSSLYPDEISEDRILIVRNTDKSFLVYVFREIPVERTFIIPELYIKNRSKNKTGLFLFKAEDYCVETELKGGDVVRSDLIRESEIEKSRYEEVFTSLSKYRKKDTGRIYNSDDTKKTVLRCLLIFILCFFLLFTVFRIHESRTKEEIRRELAQSQLLREEENKRLALQKQVSDLKTQYESIRDSKNIKIKDALLVISACLKDKGSVRSLDMNNLMFSLEVQTDEGIASLRAFENNKSINRIRLTRYSEESKTASFTGEFSESVLFSEPYGMSLTEQKDYYEKLIDEYEQQKELLSISEYMGMLEKLLKESLCTVASIAQREDGEGSVVDVQFTCSVSSLLSFLEKVQTKSNYEIRSFRISNSQGSLSCSAIFVMDEVKTISEKSVGISDEGEVNAVFENKKQFQQTSVQSAVRTPVYSFVGKGRNADSSFILIKGSDGKIERIVISDNTDNEGSCVQTVRGYTVNMGGQIFEVRL